MLVRDAVLHKAGSRGEFGQVGHRPQMLTLFLNLWPLAGRVSARVELLRSQSVSHLFFEPTKGKRMNKDTIEGKWKQLAGKARTVWGEITDDDWAKVKGDATQLAGLVQERYGRTREEAEREVKDFYDKYDR